MLANLYTVCIMGYFKTSHPLLADNHLVCLCCELSWLSVSICTLCMMINSSRFGLDDDLDTDSDDQDEKDEKDDCQGGDEPFSSRTVSKGDPQLPPCLDLHTHATVEHLSK